ncbi:MAG: HTH-type transcriptional regulator MhqR [Pelotomaculum sp. PtaB.Bin013]|uniref:MarR family transcriptional regulator n=1 Tax=Pelotomaculum isophthalicicum JI TaxID=947010 RepID=A0A9X4H700_9FIRM|nr:MarR family transcriptional regulator [Pelotomaculum isophthalicicum]MDF9409488.1 MarR family transcriptional regulator [Pelotomaculum isophthalicicum JI]OPX92214.1 MAG: HTH-type transcriptional regulator MhqR [Pelotomaculum sp. PtaB.Bin013]
MDEKNIRDMRDIMQTKVEYLQQFEENLDRANRILKYLTQLYLGRKGLSLSRYRIMRYLHVRQDVNMTELQNRLLISAASLTELADSLEKEGLVQRVRQQADRRMVYLHLTEKGRAVYKEVLKFRCERLEKALSEPEDLTQINDFLERIISGLKEQVVASDEGFCSKPDP